LTGVDPAVGCTVRIHIVLARPKVHTTPEKGDVQAVEHALTKGILKRVYVEVVARIIAPDPPPSAIEMDFTQAARIGSTGRVVSDVSIEVVSPLETGRVGGDESAND